MKLALVVPGGVDRDGETRVIPALLNLIARLARAHEVHVFALNQEPLPGRWTLTGATVHNIGEGSTQLRGIVAIRAEHRRAPFDLVQSVFSGPCGFIAVAATKLLRLPAVVHVAGGELVALHDIAYGGRRTWTGRMREWFVLRHADAVTAASTPMLDALHALGVAARRAPLGVDLQCWPPRAPRRQRHRPARLIHVASLNRVKDQATLMRALALLAQSGTDFEMDIVGMDTLHGEVQRLAIELGLQSRVRFIGFRTARELRPLMEEADLLVMSSRHEAGPVVVLEAAAAGVPTVGTAVGHIADWSPEAALAVPVRDPPALAEAVRKVLDDDALRVRMASAAQDRAILEDADFTARFFEALHLQIVANEPQRGFAASPVRIRH